MKNSIISTCLLLCALLVAPLAYGQADIEVNTPAITVIKESLKNQHQQLRPYYDSGAVGLTRDGMVAVRDAKLVPLSERQKLNSLVAAQNKDRSALYKEIAVANGHPEWESEIRSTFAERWISKAKSGWWVQNASGAWIQK